MVPQFFYQKEENAPYFYIVNSGVFKDLSCQTFSSGATSLFVWHNGTLLFSREDATPNQPNSVEKSQSYCTDTEMKLSYKYQFVGNFRI
jgi:hypothetical protein